MKLSQLVAYRSLLEDLTPRDADRAIESVLGPVLHSVQSSEIQFPKLAAELQENYHKIIDSLDTFYQPLSSVKQELNAMIESLQPSYLAASYELYDQGMVNDSVELILDRRIGISEQHQSFIQSRIGYHSDWHYPGMIIRPGRESWIEHMVACDPLYVVDQDHELFVPVKSRFNDVYQNRLRYVVIRESLDPGMMSVLPNEQIGFCLAFNFFHFKPFEIMRCYLAEIYTKLRPGGTLAFTFNDCDRRGAVENAERSFMCYTPGSMVRSLAESLGFVMQHRYEIDAAVTWIEMQKPGEISSLRGGQSLAKVVAKSK
jgi:SAM-dependent methyltransferase